MSRLLLVGALVALAAPLGAQVPAEHPVGGRQAATFGLQPFAGRRVAAIEITGNKVTKERVITREIRTSCAASRRRATSSPRSWAPGSATTAGPGSSSPTSR